MKRTRRCWTQAEAIAALQQLALELGHTPTQLEADAAGDKAPTKYTLCTLFGSVRAAQSAAGLDHNKSGPSPLVMCRNGLHAMEGSNVVIARSGRQRERHKRRARVRAIRMVRPEIAERHSPAALAAYWHVQMERAS
jgi:hypothetical protein